VASKVCADSVSASMVATLGLYDPTFPTDVQDLAGGGRHRCGFHTCRMAYYLLEYALIDDYVARRAAFREAHLALAREAHRSGNLILAGAMAEPTDRAVLVWRTDDRSIIERFVDGDPYVHNGLVTSWTIRPWTVVVGDGTGKS
jgi:uncharacterized protein YciI